MAEELTYVTVVFKSGKEATYRIAPDKLNELSNDFLKEITGASYEVRDDNGNTRQLTIFMKDVLYIG